MGEDGQKFDQTVVALSAGGRASRLLKSGDIIGDSYRLKKLLGQGGMGYVFRAEHIIIGKDYALKMLAPDQINEVTWNRFQSEGKAIARLDHPNIVKIYNMGVDQGQYPYYVMDLLEGVVLSDCIADKLPLSLDAILDLFIQLASGFGYAHSRGIIHRDVKPSNVVLVDSGGQYPTAKIVDFGIAKLVGANDLHHQSLTATGAIFGSPYYMSPEQCLGTEIDHRADIYSLGCTLFEALCGHPPFEGESALQTVMMHQSSPTPTLESASGKFWGEEMEALVAKMMMKRPAERYQSMDQVLHDLDRIWEHKEIGKNVETGFKSSVDSQLEDLGSKYEGQELSNSGRNKIWIGIVVATVVFASAVCAGTSFWATNRPKPKKVSLASQPLRKELAEPWKGPAKGLPEAEKKFSDFKTITSSTDKRDGKRVFRCPDFCLGELCWEVGKTNIAGIDLETGVYGAVNAIGEAWVPANLPIYLALEYGRDREIWSHPETLAKFGPSELSGLRLAAESGPSDVGLDEAIPLQRQQVIDLVKAIAGWTNCQRIEFYHSPAPDQALIELDNHQTLNWLQVRSSDLKGKVLAKRKFLHNLTTLNVAELDDNDAVLTGLKGSQTIAEIRVQQGSISASGLKALAGCHNLKVFMLERLPVDNAALEAIAAIKSLKILHIAGAQFQPEQIPAMAKLAFIEKVSLNITGWPGPKMQELNKYLPNAQLQWSQPQASPAPSSNILE